MALWKTMAVLPNVETREAIGPDEARSVLDKAPGVELWPDGIPGPTMRAAAGSDEVLVGRVRQDSTSERGLQLWIASDPAHLAAVNAIALAEARLRAR